MDVSSYKQDKPKVMVIDDDESIHETTGLILEEEGYQVEPYSTGEEAVDKINKNIHAVVLDINMPGLTGFQAFKKIKVKNPYVPIIFHTCNVVTQEERRGLRRQFTGPMLMSRKEAILNNFWIR